MVSFGRVAGTALDSTAKLGIDIPRMAWVPRVDLSRWVGIGVAVSYTVVSYRGE